MSPFEKFHRDFLAELDLVVIPPDAWGTPPAGDEEPSWDRKAAWLLYCEREGRAEDEVRRSYQEEEEAWLNTPEPNLTEDGY